MSDNQVEEETKQIESVITSENQTLEKEEEGENYSSIEEYFVDCCRYNDLEEAKDCIRQGCDITWFDNNLNNGIHMACANGNIEVLQLIKSEIDKWTGEDSAEKKLKFINQKNADKNTPLHWAAINGQTEVIEFMVKIFNADPNLTNAMNKLPFDEAVLFNHKEAAESLAKVTKEDMSIYEGMEDLDGGDQGDKQENMDDS